MTSYRLHRFVGFGMTDMSQSHLSTRAGCHVGTTLPVDHGCWFIPQRKRKMYASSLGAFPMLALATVFCVRVTVISYALLDVYFYNISPPKQRSSEGIVNLIERLALKMLNFNKKKC
ncbi:unnamed protein product [Nippostrongylus brasiliensis]|uniref:Uncharacterized protein n=1 Tax=Nippostrongylus brasiliensis TaxID=27835 RepID=A0A0N4YJF5_NIPBR|nr:unnamed protein product [Nippostrongylus brasiliensis]